ncbi:MAG TPA: phage antirepressor KilAC domain-containing protein [Rhodoglobus sp.]|jgi:DNA-damage-inducible protein D|nr:phage antirepressor KilAC domain-containing protein [Rhodoglobus sp.]
MTALDVQAQLDSLKIATITDGDVWSARDLMPFAGYDRWERFSGAISRAIESVNASGLDASDHFRGAGKMVQIGSGSRREIEDVELTRYGCYILFQNADSRKPEIAALQQYFAVQARKQELAPATVPTGADLIALAVIEAQQMLAAKDQQIAELEPRAEAWDELASASGDYEVADAAKMLARAGVETGRQRLFTQLQEIGWIFRGPQGKWKARQSAVDSGYLAEKPMSHHHPRTGELVLDPPQVRVTLRGVERLRVRLGSIDLLVAS